MKFFALPASLALRRTPSTALAARARVVPVPASHPDTLFLHWLAFAGVLLFAGALLWRTNVLATLTEVDPTYITLVIILVFVGSTAWCGARAWRLGAERRAMEDWIARCRRDGRGPRPVPRHDAQVAAYLWSLQQKLEAGGAGNADTGPLTDVLADRLHGPSETAWWVNGIQIKLGLLGKVIGFSILALQISQIENFDPSQTQNLLKSLTGGLGIALLITAVGLVANILLGMQLVRIDRYADTMLADALHFVETELPAPSGRPALPAAEAADVA
ncbi:MAG: hypothetical protein ACTHL1_02555 [Burkholderiaceae bacterium]